MTLQTSRHRVSLDDAMGFVGAEWIGPKHIAYDPDLAPQYRIRRASKHDGTLIHSIDLMHRALMPLFKRESYYKPMGEPPPGMAIRYTIGRIKAFSVYGMVKLPAGTYPGERECVVIPVRCEYVPIGEAAT